ncbi:arsenate reductase (glutaredoxin) [Aliiroseovarius lamellibrachiae]|uniref:arsenate reductase (glutaredoxin) n=1 Tax=Aliiroseovarius lamellibrachiae TaxID=1924933 RepID=UPI001BE081E9|nr:arsenate reductase (glutaredoxin) [Aliiroseovarius lamellibrachiae]MBT2129984.1 arsenate reductase (glutaredoxin) [Aliiroseovarius lamellibrachiae]
MSDITIWHNPRCSKSRQTLALIEDKGDVHIRKYLDDAPSTEDIRTACRQLAVAPIDIMRTGERLFKELGLSKTDAEDTLIKAMAAHPILIERPIVFHGGKARIGRPPESVLEIL